MSIDQTVMSMDQNVMSMDQMSHGNEWTNISIVITISIACIALGMEYL